MSQDDIEYILEILEDAIDNRDWDLITEAQQYVMEFLRKKSSKYSDNE